MRPLFFLLFFLVGCSGFSLNPDGKDESKFGARSIFTDSQPVENIDLIYILTGGTDSGFSNSNEKNEDNESFSKRFDDALRKFTLEDEESAGQLKRNRLQDRIIISSNELCETYKTLFKRKQARFNQWAGVVSIAAAAAGTIAPAETTAKVWSGISGTSSGIRAEYNQNYFSNLAAHAIAKGINKRRGDILEKIDVARNKPLAGYTVEMAIADAIVYHGACSLIGGLEQLDSAVTSININVGLDALGANSSYAKMLKEKKDTENTSGGGEE